MNVLILANTHSGRGKAMVIATRLAQIAGTRDHHARVEPFGNGHDPARLDDAARWCDALAVCGGDGSIHHAATLAIRHDKPIYHIPMGNENLFAREFGMTSSPQALLAALETRRERRADIAQATNTPAGVTAAHFLLMLSLGPDSSVVERLHQRRNGPVGHLAYFAPILAEARRPSFPRLTVVADGRELVREQRGWLIVANSRQYALRLDPAASADIADGVLDVAFMPSTTLFAAVAWVVRARLRRTAGATFTRCRQLTVSADDAPIQVDGEFAGRLSGTLEIAVRPASLRVLLPR
ncbi:MAG: diacylglycerol/lipid kinase family protein [Phycisphaerales bacterium]